MKEYVYIQSTMDITVTAGLQNEDVTNPDAHIPDRLKVNPVWPKMRIMIEQGRHIYPKLIAEWDTVKSLVKAGILTIGEDADKDGLVVQTACIITDEGAYGTISATAMDLIDSLIDMLEEIGEPITVRVESRKTQNNREYLVLVIE